MDHQAPTEHHTDASGHVLSHDNATDSPAAFVPAVSEALADGGPPSITWLPYDWQLNDEANRQRR